TVIATASNPRFTVSRVDVDRPGPTYTIDTLRDLARSYGSDTELFFITGADALAQILAWKEVGALLSLPHFVGARRPERAPGGGRSRAGHHAVGQDPTRDSRGSGPGHAPPGVMRDGWRRHRHTGRARFVAGAMDWTAPGRSG